MSPDATENRTFYFCVCTRTLTYTLLHRIPRSHWNALRDMKLDSLFILDELPLRQPIVGCLYLHYHDFVLDIFNAAFETCQ